VTTEALPRRLDLEPVVVDEPLFHLDEPPAGAQPGRSMLTQQMDVSFDRHLLACGVLEVRWHPRGHDDVRMEADEHEQAVGLRQPPGLSVQRGQVGQVLVDKAHGDEASASRR